MVMIDSNPLVKTLYDVVVGHGDIADLVIRGTGDAIIMNPVTWLANSSMTLSKYVPWERHTIDSAIKNIASYFGKEIKGPIFGSHKTFEGIGIGISVGSLAGYLATKLPILSDYFKPEYFGYAIGATLLAIGGDLLGSYIKRRRGKMEGTDSPLLDSLTWMTAYPILYYALGGMLGLKYIGRIATGLGLTYTCGYAGHRISNLSGEKIGVTETIREEDGDN